MNVNIFICLFLQIFTDFDEIRQEIENETERISGNNKVRYSWRSRFSMFPYSDRRDVSQTLMNIQEFRKHMLLCCGNLAEYNIQRLYTQFKAL